MPKLETTNVRSELDAEELAIETGKSVVRPIRILGIAGSLREKSYNKLLLQAAARLLPASAELEIFDLNEIPLYDQDVEASGLPECVKALKRKIEDADALLIATPEYNHSFPGVLKNAIDWTSRPYGNNSFDGKPTAVISASPGAFGGIAGQDHLKQVLLAVNTRLVTQPAVIVSSAHEKIDQHGNLLDPNTKQFMLQLLVNLVNFTRRFSQYEKTFVAPTLQPIIAGRLKRE